MSAKGTSNRKRTDSRCCVWMDAGVVSYKLCSRNHACGACQFDQRIAEAWDAEAIPLQTSAIAADSSDSVCRAA